MQKVSDLIKSTSFFSPEKTLHKNMIIHQAWKNLPGLDDEMRRNVKIKIIKDDKLYLITSSGIWAQEMQLRSYELLEKINKILKKEINYKLKEIIVFNGKS